MIIKNIGRKKTIKCIDIDGFSKEYNDGCGYIRSMIIDYNYSMNRVYVKDKNTMKSIGYYCKRCGKIISDIELEKFLKDKEKKEKEKIFN